MLQLCFILGGLILFTFFIILFGSNKKDKVNLSEVINCDNTEAKDLQKIQNLKNINYKGWK